MNFIAGYDAMKNYNVFSFSEFEKISLLEAMKNIKEIVKEHGPISVVEAMRILMPEFSGKKSTEFNREYQIFRKPFDRLVYHGIFEDTGKGRYILTEIAIDLEDIANFGVTMGIWMSKSLYNRLNGRLMDERHSGRKWSMSTLVCQLIEKGFKSEEV